MNSKRKLVKEICGELDSVIKELLLAEKLSVFGVLARIKAKLEGLPDEVAPILFCIYCGYQECNCESSVYIPESKFPEYGLTGIVCLLCRKLKDECACNREENFVAIGPLFSPGFLRKKKHPPRRFKNGPGY